MGINNKCVVHQLKSSMTIAVQTTYCLRDGTVCSQVVYEANLSKETPPTSWTPVRGGCGGRLISSSLACLAFVFGCIRTFIL